MRSLGLWGPVGVWCGLIFILSQLPNLHSGLEQDFILRKLAHITEYAILFFLTRRALRGTYPKKPISLLAVLAALFSLLYAMSDEYHQSFVRGRVGAWTDIGIDSVGIVLAWTYFRLKPLKK